MLNQSTNGIQPPLPAIASGKMTLVQGIVTALDLSSLTLLYTVPSGKTVYLTGITLISDNGKSAQTQLMLFADNSLTLKDAVSWDNTLDESFTQFDHNVPTEFIGSLRALNDDTSLISMLWRGFII
jgi:hypothetical protein